MSGPFRVAPGLYSPHAFEVLDGACRVATCWSLREAELVAEALTTSARLGPKLADRERRIRLARQWLKTATSGLDLDSVERALDLRRRLPKRGGR